MQLILESEATGDISVKMSTVEESLDTNLKDSIESIKNDICNGNKENIECQKNIITNTVDDIDGDHKEYSDENEPELPSTAQDTKLELEIKKDGAGEEVSRNGNSYENSNSIHSNDILNSGQKCNKEHIVEEKEAEAENVLVNDTAKQKSEEGSFCNKEDIDAQITKMENNVKNTDLVTKRLNILDTKMELDNTETEDKADNSENPVEVLENEISLITDQVDEKISEMALEVDKTVLDMSMLIDEDVLNEINPIDGNISEETILIDEVESDNIASKTEDMPEHVIQIESEEDAEVKLSPENIVDFDLEKNDKNESENVLVASKQNKTVTVVVGKKTNDNLSENVVPVTSEQIETTAKIEVEKTNDIETEAVVLIASDQSEAETNAEDEKTVANKSKTVVPVALDQNEVETKTLGKSKIEKIDDDVIQIESEQDSEVLEHEIEETESDVVDLPGKKVEDDEQKNVNSDQTMKEVDILKTAAKGSFEDKSDTIACDLDANKLIQSEDDKVEVLDVEDFKELSEIKKQIKEIKDDTPSKSVKADEPKKAPIIKLSNTLDILSDDEEDQPQTESQKTTETTSNEKQCINIEDDDDIMVIDEDTDFSNKDSKTEPTQPTDIEEEKKDKTTIDLENVENIDIKKGDETAAEAEKDPVVALPKVKSLSKDQETSEIIKEVKEEIKVPPKPLLPENFLKSCTKNLADMTRDELEEFCILKIVESIVDRSNLGEIKSKLKSMAQNIDEHKKKAMMLTKQNRDLQLVLKSVQEEQKKKPDTAITPLKITRSVGMQVLMTEKVGARKKPNNNIIPLAPPNANRNMRTPNQSHRAQKPTSNQQIPVPRLVPAAANPVAKSPITQNSPINTQVKTANQFNGARISPPVQKAEKRPHNRLQSVTVDLTDDEPPAKVTPRSSPVPPVRLVSPQNLMSTPRPQLTTSLNSPRKVYIPISGPQGNIRPGQTIMLKSVPPAGPRPRPTVPNMARGPAPNIIKRVQSNRHPAPLPDAMKQYQPPNWKALPPAPDLKLSKVENGIVISWKIEGYQEDSYEEIASYQLYAYQETSSPPNTSLWKKIGDVKALPLPMACTLTQFMAGFKYYFAVRAVDVRSRLGPFSLPGSILLLNKM